ncbi:MAG TPA: carboxypeptidase regulatory-like domain-containing protein [Thermoanaerobaculia bacterium]|nr:carboxypeptidase regulatory-like domain-containing protein [Thermoanaerobaculia bacterium]
MKLNRFLAILAVTWLIGTSAFAQTTSSLTGRVVMDGNPLPGVTVTISSPALQGTRTAYTDVNGTYNFSALPPGDYTVRFEMESMQTVSRTQRIGLGQTGRVDAEMRLTAVAEAITVTASAPAVLETTEVQTNIQANLVENLPIARTLQATTTLAPGVNTNGPNPGAITISGALAADNLFLVNGAVTNENLRGQTHNLFIEDAIQETTVLTAGISAEYGRFLGGVVSAITKSGGNEFSGSLRDSIVNDAWTDESPNQTFENSDELLHTYEGTVGGRIIRDRLWFFGAGRFFEQQRSSTLTESSIPFTAGLEELRLEGKLTAQLTPRHNVIGSYLSVDTQQNNNCFISCWEETNLDLDRSLPNDFTVLRYNGILTDRFLLEASWSQKNFAFEGSGGDAVGDRVFGTWAYDVNTGGFYGAPVFCGVCDPEERNNSTYGVKGTYYLATRGLGTHNVVAGYENWAETRLSNNYQSASNYGLITFTLPTRNAAGVVTPTIAPGDLIGYFPIDQLSKGSDFVTDSFFVNDKWDLNRHLQFNVGLRLDVNNGKDSLGVTRADDSLWSPRLGVMYDVAGDGRIRLNASYSKYVNRIAETIGGSASPAGNPAGLYYFYDGPEISGLPTFEAFRRVFEWFDSVGGINSTDYLVAASIPGVNTQIRESLVSPSVDEFTVGGGLQLGPSGFVRADYITRTWSNFFITRADRNIGQVFDDFNRPYDLKLVENTNDLSRDYNAIQLQTAYRLFQRLHLGGNYTWSETRGNQVGQTGGSGPVADETSAPFAYPEFKAFAQFNPSGYLPQDQTHKVRAWVSWDQPTPIGSFNFSVLQAFDSGTPFSAIGTIDPRPYVDSSLLDAYATAPSAVNYYFSDRGGFRWDDVTSTNLAVNYSLPIQRVGLFAQAEVLNLFNDDAVVGGSTTVLTARQSTCIQSTGANAGQRCAAFNPFTETPVEGVHWQRAANFGQATTPTTPLTQGSYQLPRTFRLSVGLRF